VEDERRNVMSREADISDVVAAREQIMRKALKGEKAAWDALVKEDLWVYLDDVIESAANGDEESLEIFMRDPWRHVIFNGIARWAERTYHFVNDEHGNELPEVLATMLRLKITSLENGRASSWRVALRGWSFSTGKYYILNYLNRGRHDEEKHRDMVIGENTHYKRNHISVFEPYEIVKLREEIEEEQELVREQERQESLWKSWAATVNSAVWRVFYSLTPEEQEIAKLWAVYGMTFEEIGVAMGFARATANRRYHAILALFVHEIVPMIEELQKIRGKQVPDDRVMVNLTEHRADNLRELIARCLQRTVPPNLFVYVGT
jgi:DNA-directed RNA polymerase specialized sigma24 family protein